MLIKFPLWFTLSTVILESVQGNNAIDSQLIRHYIGCYKEFDGNPQFVRSVKSCLEICQRNHSSTFAALKNGKDCYCGNNFSWSLQEEHCQKDCQGSNKQLCNGHEAHRVFTICPLGIYGGNCSLICNKCSKFVPCTRDVGECVPRNCSKGKRAGSDCDISRFLTNVNLALNQPAYQSSSYSERGNYFYAHLAVDGVVDNDDKVCSRTEKQSISWFYVDLGSTKPVDIVVIIGIKYKSRLLNGAQIYLSSFPSYIFSSSQLCGKVEIVSDPSIEIKCPPRLTGRYIYVILFNEHLSICEIEVYKPDCGGCKQNEICEDIKWSDKVNKHCVCKEGYSKYKLFTPCEDIDECKSDICDHETTSKCTNKAGSFTCQCKIGFETMNTNKTHCQDIDECSKSPNPCKAVSSNCENLLGSFACHCKEGFKSDGRKGCTDINECNDKTHSCNPVTTTCKNIDGGYYCPCMAGHQKIGGGDSTSCEDIDECHTRYLYDGSTMECQNTIGSYLLKCKSGFKGPKTDRYGYRYCEDVNECESSNIYCDFGSTICVNTLGSYNCKCKDGFDNFDYQKCYDINECTDRIHLCDVYTTICHNNYGGYSCECLIGYTTSSTTNLTCQDIDECNGIKQVCDDGYVCTNVAGSYLCHCGPGYERLGSSKGCNDIDECRSSPCDDTTTSCSNFQGSFTCVCKDGFWKTNDEFSCEASWSAGKTAVIFIVLLIILAIFLLIFLKRRCKATKAKEKVMELTRKDSTILDIEEHTYGNITTPLSTTRIQLEDLSDHIRKTMELESNGFENEFKEIPKSTNSSMEYAQNPNLKHKNRFQNIFPYDHSRIKLTKTGNNKYSDYINASYVKGYGDSVQFIAAQGPTDQTVDDFWKMIIEQSVDTIVMLTQLVENNKNKCYLYWPEGEAVAFGNVKIDKIAIVTWEKYIKRVWQVTADDKKIKRRVTQWHYIGWPDHGIPTDIQSFLRFRNNVRRSLTAESKALVHCSAGVGRTGCFIAIDILLEEAKKEGSVDVVNCITKLREDRTQMVQTAVQYDFIYLVLKTYSSEEYTLVSVINYHNRYLKLCNESSTGQLDLKAEYGELVKALPTIEAIKEQSVLQTTSTYWKAYSVDGFASPDKYMTSSFPSDEATEEFWRICLDRNCFIILIDTFKGLELPFLPSANKSLMLKGFTVHFVQSVQFDFGTVQTASVVTKYSDDSEIYENKESLHSANDCPKQLVTIIYGNSTTEEYLSRECFVALKNQMEICWDNLKTNHPPSKPLVICRHESPLGGIFIACCNLFDQMATFQEVDVCHSVLELKQSPVGSNLNLLQYKKIYKMIDEEIVSKRLFQVVL